MSKRTHNQTSDYEFLGLDDNGKRIKVVATVRHDDNCKNGYNSFSITAVVKEQGFSHTRGCQHEVVAKYIPELAGFIKWHLCGTDGPMHYIANSVFHAEQGELDHFRSSAIWPDAPESVLEMDKKELTKLLEDRKPELMRRFQADVEKLGLTY